MGSSFILLLLTLLPFGYGVIELHASLSPNQIYRTGYHFQPLKNFINDPNGPMLYKGIYHLFYQYSPEGDGLSGPTRVWGHSTSTDLINWTPQPIAIGPQLPPGQSGWSGSTTILPGNKPTIIFTAFSPTQQVQDVAVPKNLSDPYLREWALIPQNPVMLPTQENKIDPNNFRDPTTAWRMSDGVWRVIIGSTAMDRGLAILYKSKDFTNWIESNDPLYSENNAGMWECPDFYPVKAKNSLSMNEGVDTSRVGSGFKHVLKVSSAKTQQDVYTIGSYDSRRDAYVPDVGSALNDSSLSLRYDYGGVFYASKTFYDGAKKRRVLVSWIKEPSGDDMDRLQGWSGIHGIPRSIWLDKSGKLLIQWPVSEVETLRENPISLPPQLVKGGSVFQISNITAAQADVEISFNISKWDNAEEFNQNWTDPQSICSEFGASVKGGFGPFGLLTFASKGLEEYTAVFFRVFRDNNHKAVVLMCSDQSRSSLNLVPDKTTYGSFMDVDPIHDGLFLRVLIDHSVVESFGGKGKSVITARVYPILATNDQASLFLFNNGTESVQLTGFTAWTMNTANIA